MRSEQATHRAAANHTNLHQDLPARQTQLEAIRVPVVPDVSSWFSVLSE
jgi:hypothetical protein